MRLAAYRAVSDAPFLPADFYLTRAWIFLRLLVVPLTKKGKRERKKPRWTKTSPRHQYRSSVPLLFRRSLRFQRQKVPFDDVAPFKRSRFRGEHAGIPSNGEGDSVATPLSHSRRGGSIRVHSAHLPLRQNPNPNPAPGAGAAPAKIARVFSRANFRRGTAPRRLSATTTLHPSPSVRFSLLNGNWSSSGSMWSRWVLIPLAQLTWSLCVCAP